MPNLVKNKRVLDLSRIIVGPYASSVLAGFGCEVIKVQSPQGDPTRLWGPPWNNDTSTYFESVNFNKKSIALNLKHHKCRQILYKLVQKSDIVLQNFVPGVTHKLHIDYDTLIKYNHKLVYCSVSGYGDFGSKANFPAFDNIIQAETGFMHLTGSKEQPFKMGFAITDVLTALYASNAILAGIIYSQQNNKGIHVKTSLYECAISSLINQGSNYLNGNINPQRLGNHHPNIVPYGLYSASDGEVVICVGTVKQYEGLLRALKINTEDERIKDFRSNQARVKERGRFDDFLNKQLKKFTSEQIIKQLNRQKVPCGRVNDLEKVFSNKLTEQLKMVQEVGKSKMVRNPIRTHLQSPEQESFSEDIKVCPPPKIGEHTRQLLRQILGMSEDQINHILKINSENL